MSLQRVDKIDYDELEENWRDSEGLVWSDHWEKRGYKNWREFRQARIKMMELDKLSWAVHLSTEPTVDAGKMYCDASTGWSRFYTDREQSTFSTLKDHPFFQNHERVLDMREKFPKSTYLIGLSNPRDERIILVDGHHRATALAGMEPTAEIPPVHVALGRVNPKDFEWYMNGGKLLQWQTLMHEPKSRIRTEVLSAVNGAIGSVAGMFGKANEKGNEKGKSKK
jgi:hypothetical protein